MRLLQSHDAELAPQSHYVDVALCRPRRRQGANTRCDCVRKAQAHPLTRPVLSPGPSSDQAIRKRLYNCQLYFEFSVLSHALKCGNARSERRSERHSLDVVASLLVARIAWSRCRVVARGKSSMCLIPSHSPCATSAHAPCPSHQAHAKTSQGEETSLFSKARVSVGAITWPAASVRRPWPPSWRWSVFFLFQFSRVAVGNVHQPW
jgi:hypothetical protein